MWNFYNPSLDILYAAQVVRLLLAEVTFTSYLRLPTLPFYPVCLAFVNIFQQLRGCIFVFSFGGRH